MQQRNKDLPASAVHPIQDKFGQIILMTGFTKHEAVALELLKSMMMADWQDDPESINFAIKEAYTIAEQFCSYLETESENESGLIQSV